MGEYIPITDGVRRPSCDVTTKMPASKHGDVQTDKYDGRKFITMRVSSNGEPAYRKLYLRTKDHPTARRQARAVEHLDDAEDRRKLIRYPGCSQIPETGRRGIVEAAWFAPLIPTLDHETVREESRASMAFDEVKAAKIAQFWSLR